jgi:hypothetical protein
MASRVRQFLGDGQATYNPYWFPPDPTKTNRLVLIAHEIHDLLLLRAIRMPTIIPDRNVNG